MTTIAAEMLLAFDTSSAACTVALFDDAANCVARRDELIGRGHAERLVPMIAELMDGRRADQILVGVGPGSFTGIRVAIAAAHGLAIGWNAELKGMSSLALLAASAASTRPRARSPLPSPAVTASCSCSNSTPPPSSRRSELAQPARQRRPRARQALASSSVPARKRWSTRAAGAKRAKQWPSAANALKLAPSQRSLPPRPVYARAPDARVPEAA